MKEFSGLNLILGSDPNIVIKEKPFKIFENHIIEFLSFISNKILKDVKNQTDFRELIGFAFWIRKKNLLKIKSEYINIDKRFGRGTCLHIAPGNIPVNALYTLVFGLLSGSPSIVRISNSTFSSLEIIFKRRNGKLK